MATNSQTTDLVTTADIVAEVSEALGLTPPEARPKGAKPADFNTPLKGDLPVLVLAGEFDPVTPPRYGEEIVKTLPRSRLLVMKGQGHGVLAAGCMPKLFAQFVERADAKGLDAGCLDSLTYTPPFTGFNGWEP